MKIVIIGSGNVAFHLAKAFVQNQIPVSQIFGRNENNLKEISEKLKINYSTTDLLDANFYLICVNDASITNVSSLIKKENCLVAHTSGSVSKNELVGSYQKASFYPLQTFSKSKNLDYKKIPFFIDAENEEDKNFLQNLAKNISEKVMFADDKRRKSIHLTAVFACNFVNHLFARAKEISDSQNISFDYFLPLIDETVAKIHEIEPKLAQTGPAIRNDKIILDNHEELLSGEKLEIYKTMNESIKKMYQ